MASSSPGRTEVAASPLLPWCQTHLTLLWYRYYQMTEVVQPMLCHQLLNTAGTPGQSLPGLVHSRICTARSLVLQFSAWTLFYASPLHLGSALILGLTVNQLFNGTCGEVVKQPDSHAALCGTSFPSFQVTHSSVPAFSVSTTPQWWSRSISACFPGRHNQNTCAT